VVPFNGPRRQTPLETGADEGNLADVKRLLASGAEATAQPTPRGSRTRKSHQGRLRESVNGNETTNNRGASIARVCVKD
jgi:hypothetical protein